MGDLALIAARGGSKRLPRKNILPFLGRPILGYTIRAARDANLFDTIVVSTDDPSIAAVAVAEGATVDARPAHLAGDDSSVAQVCLDLLHRRKAAGFDDDRLCCLYPTAPLRNADDIRSVMALLAPPRCCFAIAATKFSHYAHQALKLHADGTVEPMWPDVCEMRASEVGNLVAGNGSTYAVSVPEFLRHREFYGPTLRAHLMPFHRSVDIDTAEDFALAEALARGFPGDFAPP